MAWAVRHHSVSPPRSSNRTCGFPASGSPTGFTARHTVDLLLSRFRHEASIDFDHLSNLNKHNQGRAVLSDYFHKAIISGTRRNFVIGCDQLLVGQQQTVTVACPFGEIGEIADPVDHPVPHDGRPRCNLVLMLEQLLHDGDRLDVGIGLDLVELVNHVHDIVGFQTPKAGLHQLVH